MWHPWRVAGQQYPHINIVCDHRLPRGIAGLFKDTTIWLCSTLTQAERRSTLTHELHHVTRGVPAPTARVREERVVDELAACQLIPLPEFLRALRQSQDDHDLAEQLWTDIHTVRIRRETLTPLEKAWLDEHLDDDMLTDQQQQILDFEAQWWATAGGKEDAIRDQLAMTPVRYYQQLNQLLDTEAALAHDPVLVNRLRRIR